MDKHRPVPLMNGGGNVPMTCAVCGQGVVEISHANGGWHYEHGAVSPWGM